MNTDDKSREPLNACGIINPTLVLSGTCAGCGGHGRIPVDGFECDECGALYVQDAADDFLPSRPDNIMPCGHTWSLYANTRFCKPCNGIGRREEAVTLPDLFDFLEAERERRKQEEEDRREQALSDRIGAEFDLLEAEREREQQEWERRVFGGGA